MLRESTLIQTDPPRPGIIDRLAFGERSPSDDLSRLRARLVVSLALLSLPFWILYGVLWYLTGLPRGLWFCLGGAALCLVWIPLLRKGFSPQFTGRGLALSAAGVFVCLSLFVRGFDIPLLSWNLLLPVAAMLFRGPRTAYAWTICLGLSWLLLGWLDSRGLLPHPQASLPLHLLRLLDISNLMGAMLMLVIIVGNHARVLARQDQEREKLQQQLTRSDHLASLGTLAASIGHEINNPLAYTIHNLEYLSDLKSRIPSPADDEPRALSDALEGAKRVQRISSRLNAFARRSTEPGPIRVEQTIEVALDLARSALRQVAQVEVTLKPELTVRASDELVQVWLNLLVNAADAIGTRDATGTRADKHEPGKITIEGYSDESHAIIVVSDNGSGMPEDIRTRIFDPFFTTKDPGKGTGLGLAITRQIITQLAGTISVTTRACEGTSMTVRLPLAAPQALSIARLPVAVQESARLLIIDDEPALLRAMKRHLRDYEVDTVTSGIQALGLLQTNHYDLILCDVMMPEMTGPELYFQVEAQFAQDVARRIVFMTGGAFLPEQAKALKQTGCRTLPKPIGAALVLQQLSRLTRP